MSGIDKDIHNAESIDLNKFIDLFTKNQYYDADFWISAMSLLI